jgi:hypothetical protein
MTESAPSTPPERDYAGEIQAVIDAETASGDYHTTEVAERIVMKLRATDPGLLLGFLEADAVTIIANLIRHMEQVARARQRRRPNTARAKFASAVAAHDGQVAAGEPVNTAVSPLTGWLSCTFEVSAGRKLALGLCMASDLDHVIQGYQGRAYSNSFEALWLAEIQKRIGDKKVADVYTSEQLAVMRSELSAAQES